MNYFSAIWSAYDKGEATIHELVNKVFEPQMLVNEAQARLLGATFTFVSGGPAQPHIASPILLSFLCRVFYVERPFKELTGRNIKY